MSKFKYSENCKNIIINDEEILNTRKQADDNIESSIELLRSLGKGKEVEQVISNIESI